MSGSQDKKDPVNHTKSRSSPQLTKVPTVSILWAPKQRVRRLQKNVYLPADRKRSKTI